MKLQGVAAAGVLVATMALLPITTQAEEATMTDAQVQNHIEKFAAVLNTNDVEAMAGLFTADAVDHAPWPGQTADVAGFKAGFAEMRRSFPDLHVAVARTVTQGDLLVVHYRLSGTQLGDFMGMPASNKTFNIEAIDINRMVAGRIAKHWGVLDAAGMMGQLGG